jgi:pyridoxal phosphate enzyme (YggS family)
MTDETIGARLTAIRDEIARLARRARRDPASVALECVSKTQSAERIEEALAAGQRLFGENRVQEAEAKWPALRETYPDVALHLIGPLQTNKVRQAVALFDAIETVDRPRLAEALGKEIQRAGKSPRLYVEVNTGAEPQKAGILPDEADAFLAQCRGEFGLAIEGLMCIPTADEQAAPHFALLAQIAARNGIAKLSMGMSADYPLAIQLGATHVRLGTAIFGARQAPVPPGH